MGNITEITATEAKSNLKGYWGFSAFYKRIGGPAGLSLWNMVDWILVQIQIISPTICPSFSHSQLNPESHWSIRGDSNSLGKQSGLCVVLTQHVPLPCQQILRRHYVEKGTSAYEWYQSVLSRHPYVLSWCFTAVTLQDCLMPAVSDSIEGRTHSLAILAMTHANSEYASISATHAKGYLVCNL